MKSSLPRSLAFLLLTWLLATLSLSTARAKSDSLSTSGGDLSPIEEQLLAGVIGDVQSYRIDAALLSLESITASHPNFKLAHLIYADLLMAKAHTLGGFGMASGGGSEEISGMLDEIRTRWSHYNDRPPKEAIPAEITKLNAQTAHVVLVDLARSRLYLFENQDGLPNLVKDYYISLGKKGSRKDVQGDQRTPIGVYHITEFLPERVLPDRYGNGAFPLNYPNDWDLRHKRTGYGIWLHGTPFDTYSRPPLSSDGCVTLSNRDFNEVARKVEIAKTPVIITDKTIEWVDRQQWEERRNEILSFFERWRLDWESLDTDRYLSHYSTQYDDGKLDHGGWTTRKRRVNRAKSYIKVGVSDLSVFKYPGDEEMLVVTFSQNYDSSNYKQTSRKRQYWRRESGDTWRIVLEGPG